ncbi:hypothetical protein Q4512_02345 [Oceanihabitans sp. 2_MG-2023]|uniref:hypothetical protein n=1 Tax=Oceanihabitans sp. 2_MG-2023 TaxID=3062661 RepID=UPI0026E1FAAF|nr:hypothetical protein [Oceanihabitans sp. 2_MG-2023]MDO6595736.1 hypothetical protein [Oceanihabitans sp. 2_MG-2023]
MNITYLLGAGASYNALPVVEKIPETLLEFAFQFNPRIYLEYQKNDNPPDFKKNLICDYFDNTPFTKEKFTLIDEFHKDILWLRKESRNHTSIDTYAKKLYLQEDFSLLKKLKYVLSCFFIFEQTSKFDKRYDSFFASILENLKEIPQNIKIVSWNYDSQLEIAFSKFSNTSIEKSRNILNTFSKGNQLDNISNKQEFGVFKVNGTTTITDKNNNLYDLIQDYDINKVKLINSFLEIYENKQLFTEHAPNMSFAWERFNENLQFYSDLRNTIDKTDIIIVIGYSFPFFNRKVDEFILNSIDNLKKIYVQDPYSADDILQKIKKLLHSDIYYKDGIGELIEFEAITFKDQFFIPIEF